MASNPKDSNGASIGAAEGIADLQIRLTYQEDEIRHINQVLESQRAELDLLRVEVDRLKKLVATLAPAQVGDRDDEAPPHY